MKNRRKYTLISRLTGGPISSARPAGCLLLPPPPTLRILAGLLIVVGSMLSGCESFDSGNESARSEGLREDPGLIDAAFSLRMRGALLASRFETLEDLKQVVALSYFPQPGQAGDSMVVVSMINNGRWVTSELRPGISEADLSVASAGGFSDKVSVGLASDFGVRNRNFLQQVLWLSRRRQRVFGEGDPAFYDLAAAMVEHISDLDAACLVEQDSSEKGYLNTFNHIIAQAFFTSLYSEEFADFVADVHERRTMPELISGRFTAAQMTDPITNPMDNYVDILNNEYGQELGLKLKSKYRINRSTTWTPRLLSAYLNDLVRYFKRAFFIDIDPFFPDDVIIIRFAYKLNAVADMFPD